MLAEMSECVTRVALLGSSDPRKKPGQTPTITVPFYPMNVLELSQSLVKKNGCPTATPDNFVIFPLDSYTVFRDEL